MFRWFGMLAVASAALTTSTQAQEPPPIAGQVTFLYYHDHAKAVTFYSEVLGLEKEFDLDWVKIYKLSPTSSVGIVSATGGNLRPAKDKPVMLSMVVDATDLEAWWSYLKDKGVDVGELSPEGDGAVRAFSFQDPEGYTLEVFAWLDR